MSSTPSPSQTLSFLQRRLSEVGIKPQSRHGQNFLIDLNLLRLLFDSAMIGPRDVVLEIGTGTGSLTALLAARAAAVVTVELDPQLFQLAEEELSRFDNVTMLKFDALKNKNHFDPRVMETVRARLAEGPDRIFKLAANLPYCIATPVITNLLSEDPIPKMMTVTIQKEMADRLRGRPNTKDYGALSVWVQSQAYVKVVRSLPPSAFWPRPKVMSAIVQIFFRPEMRAALPDPEFFHGFARSMFFHRRKFLRSVILHAYKPALDKPAVDEIMAAMQFGPDTRAEQLEIEQFLALSELVRQRLAKP